MWRFSLNTNQIETPIGWDTSTAEIKRLDDIKGVLYAYIPDLTFWGAAYNLLVNEWNNNNYCTPIEVLVERSCDDEDAWEDYFEGYIFLTECEFNLEHCTVSTTVTDRSYIGQIESGRKIEATINVDRSKNDITITAAPTTNITFFTPCTGLNRSPQVKAYQVYEAFRMLIEFMTDGTMGFASTLFGAGGDKEGWFITTGRAIREEGQDYAPRLSFREMVEEIDKKANVTFYIDESTNTLHLEHTEDVYETATITTLNNVRNIEMELDKRRIYNIIHLGSRINQKDDGGCPAPGFGHPDGRFFGHKEETYHMIGNCHVDNELDLTSDWIIDSNVIEDILVNDNEEYDDDIVLVETDYPATQIATKGDQFDATIRTYNPGISNQATLENFLGLVPESIAAFLGPADDEFEAQLSADIGPSFALVAAPSPVPFANEIHDVGANYNNTLYKYVTPADGAYYFEVELKVAVNWGPQAEAGDIDVVVAIQVDRGSGWVTEKSFATTVPWGKNFATILGNHPFTLYLDTTDEVRVNVITLTDAGPGPGTNQITLKKETRFSCIQATNGGGIYQTFDPQQVRMVRYKLEYPMSFTDFKTLLSGNRQKIGINDGRGFSDTGWLERLSYKLELGTGTWTIRAKNELRP